VIQQFISGGSSYSTVPAIISGLRVDNWPYHVENFLQVPSIHTGYECAGNSFILKSLLNQLSKIEVKTNLLVGVMWGQANRQTFYNRKSMLLNNEHELLGIIAPVMPVKLSGEEAFYFTQPLLNVNYNKIYYKSFYDEIGSYIETIQNILTLQWYLKFHNVKYFMAKMSGYCVPDKDSEIANHPDVKYLFDQIDFTHWLSNRDLGYFCAKSGLPSLELNGDHPSSEQSKLYTEQVIIPHLKDKGYIN